MGLEGRVVAWPCSPPGHTLSRAPLGPPAHLTAASPLSRQLPPFEVELLGIYYLLCNYCVPASRLATRAEN